MKIVHAMPEIEARHPASDAKPRKRTKLPALQDYKGQQHCKMSDREVVAIILAHLQTGEYPSSISQRTGIAFMTVCHWLDGTNRRRCLTAALHIHRNRLKAGTVDEG